jgi:hypothetical protein
MMIHPRIFVSYNPGIEVEQSTALRLQTLSSLYGATVYLPDRLGSTHLKDSTMQKIVDAQVFVMFSTHRLSKAVKEEAEFALKQNKRVVIFYDKHIGKNILTTHINPANLIEVSYDPTINTPADLLGTVLTKGGFLTPRKSAEMNNQKEGDNKALTALVGVGLGLLLLWALSSDEDEKPKKKNRHR